VNLCWAEAHLVRVVVSGSQHATQDVTHFRLVINQAQERFTLRALLADAKNIFGRRIQADDQEAAVEKNNARAQPIKDAQWFFFEKTAAARMARRFALA